MTDRPAVAWSIARDYYVLYSLFRINAADWSVLDGVLVRNCFFSVKALSDIRQ